MTRRYPYAKLLRMTKAMRQAIQQRCKAEKIDSTQFIRRAIERDLTFARRK